YHKETLVAIVYTLGIFLGPYSCAKQVNTVLLGTSFVNVVMLAFINLMVFSEFEKEEDQEAGYPSLALALGSRAKSLISGTLIVQLVFLGALTFFELIQVRVALCFSLMNLALCLIYFGRKLSIRNEYYRVIGDGIFFIPIAFLL
ncbi:MAG: hypothetical protein AAFO69_16415, partial [Bacteroidota bacterium]